MNRKTSGMRPTRPGLSSTEPESADHGKTDRRADFGPGVRSRTPSPIGLVADLVQLALSRNRRRCDRERSQHRARSRPVDPQCRRRAQRSNPRSVLRSGPPFTRARAPRLYPRHRARPLALPDPARPQARPASAIFRFLFTKATRAAFALATPSFIASAFWAILSAISSVQRTILPCSKRSSAHSAPAARWSWT